MKKRTWLVLGAAALWQSGIGTTSADNTLYVLADATQDSNLFRLSDNANTQATLGTSDRSDTYWRGEVGIRSDANVGRQHFNVTANVNQLRFDHFSYLDTRGGAFNGLWDWTVGNQWNGNLGYTYDRSLASFELQTVGKDVRTQQHAFMSGNYLFHPSWRVRGVLDGLDTDYSLATSADRVFTGYGAEVGLQYVAPSESSFGVRFRKGRGDFPNPQIINGLRVDNSYDQTDAGVTMDWRLSGHSRFFAGIDHTERTHDQVSGRDFSGPTGRMTFDWTQSEKLRWRIAAWRELTESDDLTPSYVVADGVSLAPSWEISSKLRLEATVSRVERDYKGDPRVVLLLLTERQDVVKGARLGLAYLPLAKFGLNMSYAVERRTSNQTLSDYRDRIINAGLRVEF